jgi:hypothetical protein
VDARSRERLRKLIERELERPGSYGATLDDLSELFPEDRPLFEFLRARDEEHRHAFYAKSQHVWYRRFGWRIMRPLFLLSVGAGIAFALQRTVDPVLGVALFLAGAAALYILIQIFAHRWAQRDLRPLDAVRERYRERLRAILAELGGPDGR